MTTNKRLAASQALPAGLAEVTLIDARACAATGGMGVSWWHEAVRAGQAPQPAIRQHRCTRWRLVDVRRFWQERIEQAQANPQAGEALASRLKKASIKGKAPASQAKHKATRAGRKATREGGAA